MALLSIKNLPPQLHAALKREASAQGRSLNSYVISLLEDAMAHQERLRRMSGLREQLQAFVSTLPSGTSATGLIREDRDQR
jgi:plasmid stability protein